MKARALSTALAVAFLTAALSLWGCGQKGALVLPTKQTPSTQSQAPAAGGQSPASSGQSPASSGDSPASSAEQREVTSGSP